MNQQIYGEASEWLVELRTGELDTAQRRRFKEWLQSSPEHVRAYLELAAIWNEGAKLDPTHKYDDQDLLELARPDSKVIPLEGSAYNHRENRADFTTASPSPAARKPGRAGRSWYVFAASLVLAITGVSTWLYSQRNTYTTAIGEQRTITLTDGTMIELNATTKLRQRYNDRSRTIELLEGQAFFHVAKDGSRPFIVEANNTTVRAVGTQFDVYRRDSGTTVTVIEGTVAVQNATTAGPWPTGWALPPSTDGELERPGADAFDASGTGSASPLMKAGEGEILLAAGEQAIVTPKATVKPTKPNIAAATAWIQRRLIFESATLADVANEFNRYNQRRLVIQSPDLYDFHITGTFSSTDPGSLLRFLEARPGIVITQRKEEIVVSKAADAKLSRDAE